MHGKYVFILQGEIGHEELPHHSDRDASKAERM